MCLPAASFSKSVADFALKEPPEAASGGVVGDFRPEEPPSGGPEGEPDGAAGPVLGGAGLMGMDVAGALALEGGGKDGGLGTLLANGAAFTGASEPVWVFGLLCKGC